MNSLTQDVGHIATQIASKAKDGLEYISYAPLEAGKPVSEDAKMLIGMAF